MANHGEAPGPEMGGDIMKAGLDDFLKEAFNSTADAVAKAVGDAVSQHVGHAGHHDHSAHAGHGGGGGGHDHAAMEHSGHAGHSMGGGGGGHDHAGHVMKMWFHGGCEEVILFDCWRTETCWGMLWSCVLIFVMGAVYEGIKWFRVHLQMGGGGGGGRKDNGASGEEVLLESRACGKGASSTSAGGCNGGEGGDVYAPTTTPTRGMQRRGPLSDPQSSLARAVQALLYVVQLVLAYWLMLIVMTYNTWLTAAVIVGAGFGHWLFAALQLKSPQGESADAFATDACH